RALVAAGVALAGAGVGVGVLAATLTAATATTAEPAARAAWVPPGDTVVAVEGDAENGFTVHHLDGSSLHPPTLSESTAECGEYDTEVQAAVCQAEVETWYRDLADLQVAIRWARYDAARRPRGEVLHDSVR
ncbi:hypothetical protein, partial [Nocardioides sp. ChNu-99]